MKKVRLFGDWGHDCFDMLDRLALYTPGLDNSSRRFGNLQFVNDNSYTQACVFNFATADVVTPPEATMGLLLEPPEILTHMYPAWVGATSVPGVSRYYSFCSGTSFPPAYGQGFATVPPRLEWDDPRRQACMIASTKTYTPWHKKRQEIFRALMNSSLEIDFYGRGRSSTPGDSRQCGEIPPGGKGEVLSRYQYVIDFENSGEMVVTDKYFDAVLSGAVPVTNSPLLKGSAGVRFIDFSEPVASIVDQIRASITRPATNEDREGLLDAVGSISGGSMNLLVWIEKTLGEL